MSTIVLSQSVLVALNETKAALELLFRKKVTFKDCTLIPDEMQVPAYVPDEHLLRRVRVVARFKCGTDDKLHSVKANIVVSTHEKSNSDSRIDYYASQRLDVDGTEFCAHWQAPGVLKMRYWDGKGDWRYSQDYMKPEKLSEEKAAKVFE
jgi:hypothetical protein